MGMVTMYRWGSGCCCKEVYRYPHNNYRIAGNCRQGNISPKLEVLYF